MSQQVYVDRKFFAEALDVTLAKRGDRVYVALPVQYEEIEDGQIPMPTFRLTYSMAQELIDQLWTFGIRPSDGSGSAGQVAALENHLSDMRTIAFSQLNIKPEGKNV